MAVVNTVYFANEEGALPAQESLERWNTIFSEMLEGAVIPFDTISLYGFDNMANFFSKPRQHG